MMKKYLLLLPVIISGCGLQIPPYVEEGSPVWDAAQLLGKHEVRDRKELKSYLGIDPSRTEWCAAFVNYILDDNGIPGSDSVSQYPLLARSFLDWGETVEQPVIGDIVVFPRGNQGWQGHVGFYIMSQEKNGIEYYYILGGNQRDDMVSLDLFPADHALGIRRSLF